MSLSVRQLELSDGSDPRELKLYLPPKAFLSTQNQSSFKRIRFENAFEGEVIASLDSPVLTDWLKDLPTYLESTSAQLIYRVRNRVYRVDDPFGVHPDGICVKAFKAPSRLRSLYYRSHGSKAARAHRYAAHLFEQGISHAQPLGFFEQWHGKRLTQSYLLTQFVGGSTDLFTETCRLLKENPDSAIYIDLLRFAASSIRRMHDCGFVHHDLGGQNLLFKRTSDGRWEQPTFIDLNRGRLLETISMRRQARDLAKLEIPSHFLKIFYHIYFGDQLIPREFSRWERWYRALISLHNNTRKYRHPIRQYRASRTQIVVSTGKPSERDFWLWDEKSGQPSVVFDSKDRKKFRQSNDFLRVAWSALRSVKAVKNRYRELETTTFTNPVALRNRFGIAVEVAPDFQQQLKLLSKTPEIPTFVRCYFHKGKAGLDLCEAAINQLHQRGHEVSLGLIQSRQAVIQPEAWREFVDGTLERLHDKVCFVEVAHAVNRVKWGYWTLAEIISSFRHLPEWRQMYPQLTFLGPAVNDFEYHYYPALLDKIGPLVDGLSCHLYVDRRGQPENFQGRFSLLEKCVLGRAIGEVYGNKRFYVTETNWPLQGAAEYSPLAGAYVHRHSSESGLHVSPEQYAAYMIRYALISLCSGMTERVWWWRLAARGYGLVDDVDGFKPRLAWDALVQFHNVLGTDRFIHREERDQIIWWHFERCSLAYSLTTARTSVPPGYNLMTDIAGTPLPHLAGAKITVSGSPVYFLK